MGQNIWARQFTGRLSAISQQRPQEILISTLQTHSLIIIGYSGRDPSVMDALRTAVFQENAIGKIFWCGFSDEPSGDHIRLIAG